MAHHIQSVNSIDNLYNIFYDLVMIRRQASQTLIDLSKGFPLVAVTGPRQSGKTTLVQNVFPDKEYVTFEDLDTLALAESDPRGFLSSYPNGAILDEVQRCPKLFSYLQTIVDKQTQMGLFILTGSQQFGLLSGITQSLAGRVGLVQLLPFSLSEINSARIKKDTLFSTLYKGLYPPLYDRLLTPEQWFANYMVTYLERDVRQIINVKELSVFQHFVRMCAARTGQLLNLSSLANDCGITHNTARSWISVLEASYIVFLLQPHHRNYGKRLVKTPKLYFYDSGLASWLLNIQSPEHLAIHPQRGGLFEGLIVSELLKARYNQGKISNLYFWRDNLGDEVDVIIESGQSLIPVEIKSGATINQDYFKALRKWNTWTKLKQALYLVYGGEKNIENNGVKIVSWTDLTELILQL